jgi:integrase
MTRRRRGEGAVYQRDSDSLWVGAVRAAGRRHVVYGRSDDEVKEKLADLRAALRLGVAIPDSRLTVGRHLAGWLDTMRPPHVRPSTWVSYELHVRHLADLATISLARLTPNDVRRHLRRLLDAGYATRTVAYSLTVLRMAIRQALRDDLVTRNVAELVDPPRTERAELRILTAPEARRLVAGGDPLWILLVGIGCRLGEALGLRWTDVDLEAGTVSITGGLRPMPKRFRAKGQPRLARVEPKTDAGHRTVALPPVVVLALAAHRTATADRPASVAGYVFTTPRGTPLDARNVSRAWALERTRLELPKVRIHDLRHTAASLMLARGFTLEDVKRVLGHSSIQLTSDTYGHLVEGRSREIASGMDAVLGGRG